MLLKRFNAIYKPKYQMTYNVRVMAENIQQAEQKAVENGYGKPVQVLQVYGIDSGNYVAIIP